MKKSWDYTQLNTGILHIHDDHLKFYSNSWGHNFVEIEINFMKWILIQVYFFVGSGMLTLYKVQKLSFIIKKGKGYTIHEKVQLSDDAIYMYMHLQARWKSRDYHSSYRNRIKSSLLILQDVSFLSNWAYHSTIHQLIKCSQTSFEVDDTYKGIKHNMTYSPLTCGRPHRRFHPLQGVSWSLIDCAGLHYYAFCNRG